MDDDLTLRPATADDAPRLRAIDLATWSTLVSPGNPPDVEDPPAFFEDRPPSDHLVALRSGEVVGWLRLQPSTPLASSRHAWMVNGLAVDPSHQGQGVAQALLAQAGREVARRGGTKLGLRVLGHNQQARLAYARAGFTVEGVLRGEFILDGAPVDDLFLAKFVTGDATDDGGRTYDADAGAQVPPEVEDPIALLAAWFAAAETAGERQPQATVLSTVDEDGRPSSRAVLVRVAAGDGDAEAGGGLVFHTNRRSRKGRELAANPHASMCSVWNILHRQVRIEGPVVEATDQLSDAYWANRPAGSRASAAASPQSEVVPDDRAWLQEQVAAVALANPHGAPRPAHWGGYVLVPDRLEFWAGRRDRLHDRTLFTRRPDGGWDRERLAP